MDSFACVTVELPREKFVTFMFSSSSPLADFENNSNPHCQGCSSMGQAGAWCCVAGFTPGQGVGAGAEQSQAFRTTVMTTHCRLALSCFALSTCRSQRFSTFPAVLHWKKPTCCSLATGLSVATLAAGL